MKTTVNLPDELLRAAQELAHREGTTLRALIEAGLRSVLSHAGGDATFTLPDASVAGSGLQTEFRDASWEKIRDATYDRP